MIAALAWDPGMRRTRRWAPGRGSVLDLRRVVRRNIRYGGEAVSLPTRDRRLKRRPLVLICDVSGSMERYARMLLHFIHSLAGAPQACSRRSVPLRDAAHANHARDVTWRQSLAPFQGFRARPTDWGGGTRIGEALRTFNVRWARRVLGTWADRAAHLGRMGSRRTRDAAPGNGAAAAELSPPHLAEPAARISENISR